MGERACNEASQRKLQTSLDLNLIGRAVKFKTKLVEPWWHLQQHHFKCGVCSRATSTFSNVSQASRAFFSKTNTGASCAARPVWLCRGL